MIKRILFVEDETRIAELYAMLLRKRGYQVDIVADGGQGYEAAKSGNYDLILLDLMLPTMSGMDILHGLHQPGIDQASVPPVVVLTNLGEDDLTAKDIRRYAQGYLLKVDVTPKQLVEYVNQMGL